MRVYRHGMTTYRPATGTDLRTERTRVWLSATAVARECGISRMTLHRWERSATVAPEIADRYRSAVLRLLVEKGEAA